MYSLAVRVMALEGRAEGVLVSVMDRGAAVRRADRGGGKQRGHPGVESGKGVELVLTGADDLGIGVLIDDFAVYASLVFSTGGMALTGGHIRYTCKRVGRDDRLDDRVERRNVCNRVRECADRTFGFVVLYEICHCFLWLPPLGPWAE